jgi:hypothetical protein
MTSEGASVVRVPEDGFPAYYCFDDVEIADPDEWTAWSRIPRLQNVKVDARKGCEMKPPAKQKAGWRLLSHDLLCLFIFKLGCIGNIVKKLLEVHAYLLKIALLGLLVVSIQYAIGLEGGKEAWKNALVKYVHSGLWVNPLVTGLVCFVVGFVSGKIRIQFRWWFTRRFFQHNAPILPQ